MTGGTQRLLEGVRWERQVAVGLTRRGYDVEPFGQALLTPRARSWLRGAAPVLRWLPDMLVHHDGVVSAVDAKGGRRYISTGRHDVEEASVWAALEWERFGGMPEWFVFRDLRCVRADDLLAYGVEGRFAGNGSGTRFLLIPADACQPIDAVFPIVERTAP